MATNRSPTAGNRKTASPSSSAPSQQSTYYAPSAPPPKTKAGPNRTTKAGGKLKILPEEPEEIIALTRPAATLRAVPAGSGGGAKPASGPIPSPRPASQPTVSNAPPAPPTQEESSSEEDSSEDEDAYAAARVAAASKQLAQIPEGSMRRDARRLTRKARANLPRVTAYSTATSYRMRDLAKFLHARRDSHRTNPMTFDECVYTTYTYELVDEARGINAGGGGGGGGGQNGSNGRKGASSHQAPHSPSTLRPSHYSRTGDLLGIPELNGEEEGAVSKRTESNGSSTMVETSAEDPFADKDDHQEREAFRREELKRKRRERFAVHGVVPEVFFMEYGTVVIWGMTLAQEKRLLRELRRFEVEKLAPEDVESEDLNWYLADYSRIYNDVITLRRGSSYMTKLSLSHALAQSTKISFFEGIIDNTIETTKDIPQSIAESGKIGMPPAEIMKQIGHLFILRMNIHLVGSIVDSPEIFWAQPDLEPLYSAARSYLEIPQRIDLLNTRVEVLQDMLQLLKDQVTSSHSEWLEIIVIVLIGLEIILGVATMIVDLYFA